ncbi:MAG: mobile mystery protein B [Leadbetterella sp.]|nr:mobile mystery protein B [Leadbetterella sp.]
MGLTLKYSYGETPLEEEELEGLKIASVSTKRELDEWEQKNIEEAIAWLYGRRLKAARILSPDFICDLHKRMFGGVWKWAGRFRTTKKNLGVPAYEIPLALKILLDDTRYWLENGTYPPDEIAIRFKHRIVSIHCFPNGNGRHSRLTADILAEKLFGLPVFTWGASLPAADEARKRYIDAVRQADRGQWESLLGFARL